MLPSPSFNFRYTAWADLNHPYPDLSYAELVSIKASNFEQILFKTWENKLFEKKNSRNIEMWQCTTEIEKK